MGIWTKTYRPSDGDAALPGPFNAGVADLLDYLHNGFPRCRAYRSAAKSIPSSSTSFTDYDFDLERERVGACHATGTTPERFFATEEAKYGGIVLASFPANATGMRGVIVSINGDHAQLAADHRVATSPTGVTNLMVPVLPTTLALGQYLTVGVAQSSGGSLNVAVEFHFTYTSGV